MVGKGDCISTQISAQFWADVHVYQFIRTIVNKLVYTKVNVKGNHILQGLH